MKKALLFAATVAASAILLTGCKLSDSDGLSLLGDSSYAMGGSNKGGAWSDPGGISNLGSDGSSPAGAGGSSWGAGEGSPISGAHNPEPATIALLGTGFAAYMFLRRKKK